MENSSRIKYLILLFFILLMGILGIFAKKYFQSTPSEQESGKSIQVVTTTLEEIPTVKSIVAPVNEPNDFALDSSAFSSESIVTISNFEPGEVPAWRGNGVLDQKFFYEGNSSLDLVSTDHNMVTVSLAKDLDLSKMEFIEFMLNVSDPDAYESAYVDFTDAEMKNFYRYPLTNLRMGWNLIQITKDKFMQIKAPDAELSWANIKNVRFFVLSRPSSIFLARFDQLRSVNSSEDYLKYWRTTLPSFLSLYPQDGKNKVMARSFGTLGAAMKDLEDINNFMFVASVSPQTAGRSGLFIRGNYDNGYGYYFFIGGDKRNTWEIMKRNKDGWTKPEEKLQGVIQNVVFSKDKTYWLRVDAKDDLMEFLFSFDGVKYEKFGEIRDNEFRGGGVGISVFDAASWSLFDNFQFKKL